MKACTMVIYWYFLRIKTEFLEESDELSAHPANWAPFVLNGQDQSFAKRSTSVAIWLILVAAGVVLIYFAVKWKRIKR
jgi:hypothetical protein